MLKPFQPGMIFLGLDEGTFQEVGVAAERHQITVAGAGSGKGAAVIIPNLLRWTSGSVLCVDPKGENAERTWAAREAMGQAVHVIDPFHVADIPARLRASFNPLAAVDLSSRTAREDVMVIADGLVKRYKAEDGRWDKGSTDMLAGLIAHTITTAPPEQQTLTGVRRALNLPQAILNQLFTDMTANPACGGLAQAAGHIGLSATKSAGEFLDDAKSHVSWLGSEPMADVLDSSSFRLSDLKNSRCSVFVVLPPNYLEQHSRFLRLFVRCALDAMAKGGQAGEKCLFLLDEFYSLGRIDEIQTAAGMMRSYGAYLWPFLQDVGQLQTLYGKEGAETFFGNADTQMFFGISDALTLEYLSQKLRSSGHQQMDTPAIIQRELAKYDGEPVARRAMIFTRIGRGWIKPAAYFAAPPDPATAPAGVIEVEYATEVKVAEEKRAVLIGLTLVCAVIILLCSLWLGLTGILYVGIPLGGFAFFICAEFWPEIPRRAYRMKNDV